MRVESKPHRGILINQIPVDGFAGFLIVLMVVSILLVSIPMLREFMVIGLPAGLIFGAALYFWHNQTRW